jgi:hypothetical protein
MYEQWWSDPSAIALFRRVPGKRYQENGQHGTIEPSLWLLELTTLLSDDQLSRRRRRTIKRWIRAHRLENLDRPQLWKHSVRTSTCFSWLLVAAQAMKTIRGSFSDFNTLSLRSANGEFQFSALKLSIQTEPRMIARPWLARWCLVDWPWPTEPFPLLQLSSPACSLAHYTSKI